MRLLLTEPARGLADLAALPLAAPFLSFAPRGDGHGVLVLPGLLASDNSTLLLRRFLRLLGYQVSGWSLGRNVGPTDEVLDRTACAAVWPGQPGRATGVGDRLEPRRHLRPGARPAWRPPLVRQVITLGSPFALADGRAEPRGPGLSAPLRPACQRASTEPGGRRQADRRTVDRCLLAA